METELRFCANEFRVVEEQDKPPRITGYAAVFNELSNDLGGFRERIAPGAFAQALAGEKEILALLHHDPKLVIGRRSAGTLTLEENNRGLYVEITPGDTSTGRDALAMVRRKDMKGMSFSFRGAKDTWERNGKDKVRTLLSIPDVGDVGPTTRPAYEATTAEVRSAIERLEKEAAATPRLDAARRRIRLAQAGITP